MNEAKRLGSGLAVLMTIFAIIVWLQAPKTQAGVAESFATLSDAKSTYDAKCAKCHGKDGRGKTMRGRLAHARDLTIAQWQNDVTDERLFNSISNGRGKMPGFKKQLSEPDIDALVSYVRGLKR